MSDEKLMKITIKAEHPDKPVRIRIHGAFIELPDGTDVEVPKGNILLLGDNISFGDTGD